MSRLVSSMLTKTNTAESDWLLEEYYFVVLGHTNTIYSPGWKTYGEDEEIVPACY